jgi:undecaprenyl diphosphate synthase
MKIPKHIALIPDGNRRWAEARGLKPWEGHRIGIERFKDFLDWCYDAGAEEVTAYSLSRENLTKRSRVEMEFLFRVYEENLLELLGSDKIMGREVCVRFIGDLGPLPKRMRKLMADIEKKTTKFKKRKLNLCVNYSSREELLRAIKELAKSKRPITEKSFEKALWIQSAPDLLIRTAEKRISNFMLWQCAYSEIHFSPKLFPDFSEKDFESALAQYGKTERRYGR